jgi:hypothetical protein
VNEYDCLMLQHVMWNRPEECDMIREWVLDRIAVDKGTNQVSYLLNGVFRRACQAQTADGQDVEACAALASETGQLREVLVRQLGSLTAAGDGELPVLRDHLWLSKADITRSSQTLAPMLKKARKELQKLLEVRARAPRELRCAVRRRAVINTHPSAQSILRREALLAAPWSPTPLLHRSISLALTHQLGATVCRRR